MSIKEYKLVYVKICIDTYAYYIIIINSQIHLSQRKYLKRFEYYCYHIVL